LTGRHLTDCQSSTATTYLLEKELCLRPTGKPPRERRRPDPRIDIWNSEIVPMLMGALDLRSVAIIEEMNRRYPGIYLGTRRTMERRIRGWRGCYGPEQELIFRQTHEPGRMGLSDFTDMADLAVTIAGEEPAPPADHRRRAVRRRDRAAEPCRCRRPYRPKVDPQGHRVARRSPGCSTCQFGPFGPENQPRSKNGRFA
jgi:hypothetical protein